MRMRPAAAVLRIGDDAVIHKGDDLRSIGSDGTPFSVFLYLEYGTCGVRHDEGGGQLLLRLFCRLSDARAFS